MNQARGIDSDHHLGSCQTAEIPGIARAAPAWRALGSIIRIKLARETGEPGGEEWH